jgi:hypothetical protein
VAETCTTGSPQHSTNYTKFVCPCTHDHLILSKFCDNFFLLYILKFCILPPNEASQRRIYSMISDFHTVFHVYLMLFRAIQCFVGKMEKVIRNVLVNGYRMNNENSKITRCRISNVASYLRAIFTKKVYFIFFNIFLLMMPRKRDC